jgi:hypothetical protein
MEDFKKDLKNLELPYTMDLSNDSDTLLITFAGISGAVGLYPFEFFKITNGFEIDKVFIRDLEQSWYHKGLKDKADSLEQIAVFLKEQIIQKKYKKVICLGNSMGGYAAMVIGTLIEADMILAFSPQTFLNTKLREKYKDNRWKEQIKAFPKDIKEELLDLRKFFEKNRLSDKSKIEIYFALDERIDVMHVLHLKDIKNIKLIPYTQGGHQLVQMMRQKGDLYKLLRNNFLSFDEDKILLVFKDLENSLPLEYSLQINQVKIEYFYNYFEKYKSFEKFQGKLLYDFFNTFNKKMSDLDYKPVSSLINFHLEKCEKWFSKDKNKPQIFGTFVFIKNSKYLLSIQSGTKNLHFGFVKYEKRDKDFKIVKMDEKDFEYLKSKLNIQELTFRKWGSFWCSVDLGEFIDLSLNYQFKTIKFKNTIINSLVNSCKGLENE